MQWKLKRNLLLFTQIKSLEIPTVLAINMADQIEKKGISIDVEQLEKDLQTKIVLLSAISQMVWIQMLVLVVHSFLVVKNNALLLPEH